MIIRVFRALYNGLDATRRLCANILFALFLLMVVVIVMLAMSSPSVPEGAILAVDIRGQLVMSPSELGVGRRWLSRVTGKATFFRYCFCNLDFFIKENRRRDF